MFKITKLVMFNNEDRTYDYNFEFGLNYFVGKNSSGKSQFYYFIDFMFGSSYNIASKRWYKESLSKASMHFEYNGVKFILTRTKNEDENYISQPGDKIVKSIDIVEYKEKLNSIFSQDIQILRNIRRFTGETITYRTFTMFNFLGENRQGYIRNFLDKCGELKYSTKLDPILNFIFNDNLEAIYDRQSILDKLQKELKEIETNFEKQNFVIDEVNKNLNIIGGNISYNGKNKAEIRGVITANMEMNTSDIGRSKYSTISELTNLYNSLDEQIKNYENKVSDVKRFESENKNRDKLLKKLNDLVSENITYHYLTEPIESLLRDIDNTIFFSNYLINDNTIKELKNRRSLVKDEIRKNDSRFRLYSIEGKAKAIALIEEYLKIEIEIDQTKLSNLKVRIRELKEQIKVLRNEDDKGKIDDLSKFITDLYFSARDVSDIVSEDIKNEGLRIEYQKKGNNLQPVIVQKYLDGKLEERNNYYIGSKARHTLMQLCGYLGFLKILLENDKYPIIPILVLDHITMSFDDQNQHAIGSVISSAYEKIGKENLQIFIFDNQDYKNLAIVPDHSEYLVDDNKSGFSPFYFPPQFEEDGE